MVSYDVRDVASYIVEYANAQGKPVSHLKLQKLLYFVEGTYMARNKHPLFPEDIEMWKLGPVVREVYHLYKQFGSKVILEPPAELSFNDEAGVLVYQKRQGLLKQDDQVLIRSIVDKYINYDSFVLVDITHEHDPWKQNASAINSGRKGLLYDKDKLGLFFKDELIIEEFL